MRAELAATPPEVVVANHCYGLFELAAVYLSQVPPMLYQARLAIDALGALLDGLRGRLGEAEPSLLESISQLRLAYVRLEGAEHSAAETAAGSDSAANGQRRHGSTRGSISGPTEAPPTAPRSARRGPARRGTSPRHRPLWCGSRR